MKNENWYYRRKRESGKAGNEILKEAKTRGHEVTAIVRNASKVQEQDVAV